MAGRHLHLLSGNQLRIDANQAISFTGGRHPQGVGRVAGALAHAEGEQDQQQGLSAITGEGELLLQAHAGPIKLAAKGKLTLESAQADTSLAAAQSIVIKTAGGASITIDGGLTFACPGTITVMASRKSFVGAGKVEAELPTLPKSVCVTCLLNSSAAGSPFTPR